MTSVKIITGYDASFDAIAAITIPRMKELAGRHGYSIQVIENMGVGMPRPSWAKVSIIRDCLSVGGFDHLLWIDADALVLRTDKDIRDVIVDGADLQIAWHGPDTGILDWPDFTPHFNCGVLLVRNCQWSREFFDEVWDKRGTIDHIWSDQAAFHWVLGLFSSLGKGPDQPSDYCLKVARLPTEWNCIPGAITVHDPIIHHFAGFGREQAALLQIDDSAHAARAISDARVALASQMHQLCLRLRFAFRDLDQTALNFRIYQASATARLNSIHKPTSIPRKLKAMLLRRSMRNSRRKS